MRRGAGKLQVIFACIFSRPTARNLTRLNACGSWFGAAVFTTATLQPWMTSSLLLNLYSKFGPAQTLRCNVSVGFFNIMQLFMSLCLVYQLMVHRVLPSYARQVLIYLLTFYP